MGNINDYDKVMNILNQNAQKNFVQRVLTPEKWPTMPDPDGGKGIATHKMMWGTINTPYGEKAVVFPRIIFDGTQLRDMGDNSFDAAMKSGEFIQFDDPKEADWFSQNYKKAWKGKKGFSQYSQ